MSNDTVSHLPKIRRIVAGFNATGRSAVIADEPVALHGFPGFSQGAIQLWGTEGVPTTSGKAAASTVPFPSPGGTAFFFIQHPPAAEIDALPPDLKKMATTSPADLIPGMFKGDTNRHFGMHYTESVDYGVMLSGEVTLILDDGEITLRPGDTYVLRGGAHAWINRGTTPSLMATFVIGAQPANPADQN